MPRVITEQQRAGPARTDGRQAAWAKFVLGFSPRNRVVTPRFGLHYGKLRFYADATTVIFLRIKTRIFPSRPGLHGPRCARLTSILGLSGTVEHAGVASRKVGRSSILGEAPFRALGLAMHAPRAKRAPANSSRRGRGAVPADLDVLWGCGVYFSPRAIVV